MKKRRFTFIIIITLCFIGAGFFTNAYLIDHMYNEMLENQISGECHLTAVNMLNDINDSISVPINVSETMAQDMLLKDYLEKEPLTDEGLTSSYVDGLQEYLNTYYQKFQYDSLFLVSTATGRYYHQDGIDRVLKPGNPENEWYFDFLNSSEDISLDVDNDEANDNAISLFIDCKIHNNRGQTIGVVGVGMKIQNTVEEISTLASENKLNAYIIDQSGRIQISSQKEIPLDTDSITIHENITDDELAQLIQNPNGTWQTIDQKKEYVEVIRIPGVNWFLLITMDNISAFSENTDRSIQLYVLIAVMVAALILLTYLLFGKLHQAELNDALKDKLTGLYNRSAVTDVLQLDTRESLQDYMVLFMMDIDDFKIINDTGGHTFGDEILVKVAGNLQAAVGQDGLAIRWGGDEFVGLLAKGTLDPKNVLQQLSSSLCKIPLQDGRFLSGSFGAVELKGDMDLHTAVSRADACMYKAKEAGKKQIYWYQN